MKCGLLLVKFLNGLKEIFINNYKIVQFLQLDTLVVFNFMFNFKYWVTTSPPPPHTPPLKDSTSVKTKTHENQRI